MIYGLSASDVKGACLTSPHYAPIPMTYFPYELSVAARTWSGLVDGESTIMTITPNRIAESVETMWKALHFEAIP